MTQFLFSNIFIIFNVEMLDRRKHTFVETIANILHHGPTYKIYKEDMHILLFLFVSFRKWPGEWLKMQNVAAKIPCNLWQTLRHKQYGNISLPTEETQQMWIRRAYARKLCKLMHFNADAFETDYFRGFNGRKQQRARIRNGPWRKFMDFSCCYSFTPFMHHKCIEISSYLYVDKSVNYFF